MTVGRLVCKRHLQGSPIPPAHRRQFMFDANCILQTFYCQNCESGFSLNTCIYSSSKSNYTSAERHSVVDSHVGGSPCWGFVNYMDAQTTRLHLQMLCKLLWNLGFRVFEIVSQWLWLAFQTACMRESLDCFEAFMTFSVSVCEPQRCADL